jgi:hypothetical protein
MTRSEIIHIQSRVGAEPDGFWGPKSQAATQKHLLDLIFRPKIFPAYRDRAKFYGRAGEKNGFTPPMKSFTPPYTMYMYGNKANKVQRISTHEKCAEAFEAFLLRLRYEFSDPKDQDATGINKFYGIYNPRMARGSLTALSDHAFSCAMDLDAGRNGLHTYWPTKAKMPIEVFECAALEGIQNLGWISWKDSMHFSAVSYR